MKSHIVIVLISLALASAFSIPEDAASSSNDNGVYDYHRKVGIPRFQQIKEYEDGLLKSAERMAGGSNTLSASVPYQAGIIMTVLVIFSSVCSGSLISDQAILTAAHCHNDGNSIASSHTVVLGSSLLNTGGTRVSVTDVVIHPGYNPNIVANDIAIFRIPRVSFGLFIQPIALPSGSELSNNFIGDWALASGFGVTSDGQSIGVLQSITSVNVEVISNDACTSTYGGLIQDHHLCTSGVGGVGICDGDHGGPLAANSNGRRVLIGVASFRSGSGCSAGLPSAYIRVTSLIQWIWANQ